MTEKIISWRTAPLFPIRGIREIRGSIRNLEIISPVEVGKEVGARFAFAQEIEIDLLRADLFVKPGKTSEMVLCSLCGVVGRALVLDQECPIARLCEEKLARGLPEGALDAWGGGIALAAAQFRHATGGVMQRWVNPGVAFVDPDAVETVLAP